MQSTIEPPGETIQRFNRFWDNLLPARHYWDTPAAAPMTLAKPLPRSLSLVRVENLEGVSVADRAILLLRGWEAYSSRVSRLTLATAPFLDTTLNVSAHTSRLGPYSNAAHTTSEIGLT